MNKQILELIKAGEQGYYGRELNVVQIYRDPKVSSCFVCRVEDDSENWCFVINLMYGDTLEAVMLEDCIELEPGQKINKTMFGDLRLF